ncbi:hypothetical protein ACVIHH_000023 [Bradyrhizobium sp. USDA 4518]
MRVLSITEQMRLTRSELCGLLTEAEHILRSPTSPESEQAQARANIAAVRAGLVRRRSGPAP